ncbi:dihydrolipoyl dehydrogenase family protein [Arthrobacter sp. ERGS1:01]|uniref:dihydrolipoyl dehydrogenase family protein n=1 Tax=Arthrobacter sp. ERGS1:01 TaxID=1704044 RepID=UPI000A51BDA8|nr:FAD-dependent oxidoreductase [Arthrobacter sp. ERGS1:01]
MVPAIEVVDAIVVGMGPGGESVAGELAAAGLSVVGVESGLVGGECPYFGCVPSKMMIRAGNALAEARRVPGLAGTASVVPDWAPVAARIRDEATDNWDDAAAAKRFTDAGGRLVRGTGRLTGVRHVTITTHDGGELTFRARRAVVLNPGTDPAIPSVPGLAGTPFWTNREAVRATLAPESLAVWGAGPIGMELAQAFARFGTKVTMVVRGAHLASREEPETAELLEHVFAREGIEVLTNTTITGVEHSAAGFTLALDGPGATTLAAEKFLVATGRASKLGKLGLDQAGIAYDGRTPPAVDDHLQLGHNLYLIGDAVGAGAFTHMSMYHANIVAGHVLGEDRGTAESHAVPRVTFTDPEAGAVGLTERQARAAGLAVRTGYVELADSTRGWIHKSGNDGFIKVIEDSATGVLVGATSVGPHGGEVLSALALAVHARVPVATLKTMVYAYPTFHRAIEAAVRAIK